LAALRRWMWWIHLVPAAAPPIPALPLRVSLDPQQRLGASKEKRRRQERSRRAAATAWCCVTRRGGGTNTAVSGWKWEWNLNCLVI
jgi:hypothetical protein